VTPRVFLSVGEASGDVYASALVGEMKSLGFTGLFEGIGGPKAKGAGVRLLADTSRWGAIGIAQALQRVPRIFNVYYAVKRHLAKGPPGLFIPIDFGYMNVRLARHAKNRGWKVMYFIPPGSWRRDRQGKDLPAITDAIVTPFEWSAAILNRMGGNAKWFGHPLKQIVSARRNSAPVRDRLAVLPGSRHHELDANLPLLAEVLVGWSDQAEFAIAPGLSVEEIRGRWEALSGRDDLFTDDTLGVLLRARAGLVCSGTATLEAALCGCPMVVFYAFTASMRREAKLIRAKRPKFIALPNILLDKMVVPEYVSMTEIDPHELRPELDSIWPESDTRNAQLQAFEEIESLVGPDDGITKAAALAVSMIAP
jgi:lipid-A-disaccharide synthase